MHRVDNHLRTFSVPLHASRAAARW